MFNKSKNKYWGILISWLIIIGISIFTMPNISQVTKEKGSITLPSNMQSQLALELDKKDSNGEKTTDIVAIFNKDTTLTDEDSKKITEVVSKLKNDKDTYGVVSIISANDNDEVKKQLLSEDKTTELVLIKVKKDANLDEYEKKITDIIKIDNFKTYVTGSELLNREFSEATELGIQKTEIIAAIFIFIVLIIIFKSPIIPIVSLSTVGISLIVSLNIIMNLAKYWNFPISDFTQVFLVVVLFGIGTDYNILLYEKFREELSLDNSVINAAIKSIKTAGRTILYSGIAVMIGFSVLYLAKLSFYQSATGVAIGIIILLLNLLTLNLFFMIIFGQKLFWPSKNISSHKENKLWKNLSKFSISKPFIMLSIIGIVSAPFLFNSSRTLNYNNTNEIPDNLPNKQGFIVIEKHFSKGMTSPTTLYIENNNTLTTSENLAKIDEITEYISKVNGVKSVLSVTRPSGEKIDELYLKNQLEKVTNGLSKIETGVKSVNTGLQNANSEISNMNISANLSQINTLSEGMNTLNNGGKNLSMGINNYVGSVNFINNEISETRNKSITSMNSLNSDLLKNIDVSQLNTLNSEISTVQNNISYAGNELTTGAEQLSQGISQATNGISVLNNEIQNASGKVTKLNQGLNGATQGLTEVENGTKVIYDYTDELSKSYLANTIYIPKTVIENNTLEQSYSTYLTKDYKTAKINIILNVDPSSKEATTIINEINKTVEAKLKGTSLNNAKVIVGGQSSEILDLETVSSNDFNRTALIMLIGIATILILVTKSLLQPLAIILSLVISYFVSLEITELISKTFLGTNDLTWNTPFFTFIMIIALGVDYSIFLMMRYKENLNTNNSLNSILSASAIIGVVVASAAIILGGTFAALIPSGITTLIQVAISVIIGLLLLFIILPILVSATISLSNK